jgi:hypothetical protein
MIPANKLIDHLDVLAEPFLGSTKAKTRADESGWKHLQAIFVAP